MAVSSSSVGSIVPPGVSPDAAEALRLRTQLDLVHAQLRFNLRSGARLSQQRMVDLLNAYMDALGRLHPGVRFPNVKVGPSAGGMAPSVCVTPAQPSPMPIPYPNVSSSGPESQQAKQSTLDATHQQIKSSTNAAPEHTSGLVSNYVKGACEWMSYSFDVKLEGKSVVLLGDGFLHNRRS
jgi:hypothetical protein